MELSGRAGRTVVERILKQRKPTKAVAALPATLPPIRASGGACTGTYTDELGRFEHFVPPGPALLYIADSGQVGVAYRNVLDVPDDRDPDPVVLMQDEGATDRLGIFRLKGLPQGPLRLGLPGIVSSMAGRVSRPRPSRLT